MDLIIFVITLVAVGFMAGWTFRSMKGSRNVKKSMAYKSAEGFGRSFYKGKD